MKPPTARQIEVHAVILRHDGNERRAAEDLGVSYVTVHKTEMAYLNNTGESKIERPQRPPSPMSILHRIPERLDRIEEVIRGMAQAEADRDAAVRLLIEKINEFAARQPIMLVERYATHRRQSDGGVGGRAERGGRG